jgi:ketosteroid isomerase-like protein
MGYTTGPWEFRPDAAAEKAVAFGNYVTVWKRQADGGWKFVVDLGISNPQPASAAIAWQPPAERQIARGTAKLADVERERASLLSRDADYARAVAGRGPAAAFGSFAAPGIRLYREGSFPAVGSEAARALFLTREGELAWQPDKADVSRSGDLGYTYGTYTFKTKDGAAQASESGNYMHIWKKGPDGTWKVVLEVLNPVPKKA